MATAVVSLLGCVAAHVHPQVGPRASPLHRSAHVRMVGEGLAGFVDLDGSGLRVAIIKARWNEDITTPLVQGCRDTLKELKVADDDIFETSVPGSFELPLSAKFLALSGKTDVIIAIGCLIDGETTHFDVISNSVAQGLMDVGLQTATPVVFGVLTCNTHEQAVVRSSGEHNHGVGWAQTAVEMAILRGSALGKYKQGTMGFTMAGDDQAATPPKPGKMGF